MGEQVIVLTDLTKQYGNFTAVDHIRLNIRKGEIFGDVYKRQVHGRHIADHLPAVELKGLIASIDYSRYRYENITLDGEYKQDLEHLLSRFLSLLLQRILGS